MVNGESVENEWKGAPGLPPVLRAEAEEDDASAAQRHFGQRDFAFEAVFAEEPARAQKVRGAVTRDVGSP